MKCPYCKKEIETYCPECNKRIDNYCPFCNEEGLKPRTFYNDKNWIGFLAVPFHTEGHTILAAYPKKGCPSEFRELIDLKEDFWKHFGSTLGIAIKKVSKTIIECYKAKDVLFASLRGDIKHFHFHLIPLHEDKEKDWRKKKLYENGHLFEFLGDLEREGDAKALQERIQKGWDRATQREKITNTLKEKVRKLRNSTGYVNR